MIASVGLALADRRAARHRRRALRSVPARDQPRARRDADRPGVRVPDAGRAPLLDRLRRGRRLDDHLRDPARGPDHRARDPRRGDEHGRGLRVDGRDAPADAPEGAASACSPDAPARRQPDDPVRALDGRDRRPDRRRRPRRRRQHRALHQPGARAPRRRRDRDHGDDARPRDRADREPHRPDQAPSRRRREDRSCARSRSESSSRSPAAIGVAKLLGVGAVYPDDVGVEEQTVTIQETLLGKIQWALDYVQDPTSWVFGITEPTGNSILTQAPAADPGLPRRVALVRDGRGADADRVHHLGLATGAHDVPRCSS